MTDLTKKYHNRIATQALKALPGGNDSIHFAFGEGARWALESVAPELIVAYNKWERPYFVNLFADLKAKNLSAKEDKEEFLKISKQPFSERWETFIKQYEL